MTEEFDAWHWSNFSGSILILALLILLGLILEYGIHRLDKLAEARSWHKTRIVLYALRGQSIFWTALLGIWWALPVSWFTVFTRSLGLNIYTFLIRIAVTILVVRFLTGWIELYATRRNMQSLSLIKRLLNGFTFVVVITVILATLGVPVEGILIALAGSSVIISMALQQPLSNLFGGVMVAASNRFKPGDYIRLNTGEEGYVVDVDWFITTVRQMSNNLVVIPNALMTSAIMVNFDRPTSEMTIFLDVAVGRDQDVDQVEQVTLDVARQVMGNVPDGVPDWEPFVRYPRGLADYITRFTVALRVQHYEAQYPVTYEFFRQLQERYRQEGITIPFPLAPDHKLDRQPKSLAGQARTEN